MTCLIPADCRCACGGYRYFRSEKCRDCEQRERRSSKPERARVMRAQGYSDREIAAALGAKNAGVVRMWITRARERHGERPAAHRRKARQM